MTTDSNISVIDVLKGALYDLVNKYPSLAKELRNIEDYLPYTMQDELEDAIMNPRCSDILQKLMFGEPDNSTEYTAYRYRIVPFEEAMHPLPPIKWVIEPLLSEGSLSILVGASGSLKTYLMLHAGLLTSLGRDWLGFKTSKTKVLYIDEESGDRRMNGRIQAIVDAENLPETGLPFGYISCGRFDFSQEKDINNLSDTILP